MISSSGTRQARGGSGRGVRVGLGYYMTNELIDIKNRGREFSPHSSINRRDNGGGAKAKEDVLMHPSRLKGAAVCSENL